MQFGFNFNSIQMKDCPAELNSRNFDTVCEGASKRRVSLVCNKENFKRSHILKRELRFQPDWVEPQNTAKPGCGKYHEVRLGMKGNLPVVRHHSGRSRLHETEAADVGRIEARSNDVQWG
jgi:hypothetical protein